MNLREPPPIDAPKVAVLLATHNPNLQYLKEQVASIKAQSGVEILLYWSDDQSELSNLKEAELLMNNYPHINVTTASIQKGVNQNFLHLLERADDPTIDYFAFSDQDDLWHTDKLMLHVAALAPFQGEISVTHSTPFIINKSKILKGRNRCQRHTITTLLAENCFQGCTMVLTNSARRLVLRANSADIAWYDWWIGCLVSISGYPIHVSNGDTLYRVHENNVVGIPKGHIRIKNYFSKNYIKSLSQAENLLNFCRTNDYSNEYEQIRRWIDGCSGSFASRVAFAITDIRRRKSLLEETGRRISIILRSR